MAHKRKYKNKPVTIDGFRFDSQKEGRRYTDLKNLERAGEIKDLELQPKFHLLGADGGNLIIQGPKRRTKMTYSADFRYYDVKSACVIVEDVKGFKTAVYKMKKAIMSSMGHEIKET